MRQPEPATDRGASYRRHHRGVHAEKGPDGLVVQMTDRRDLWLSSGPSRQPRAGTEVLALGREDDAAAPLVVVEQLVRVGDGGDQVEVEEVCPAGDGW